MALRTHAGRLSSRRLMLPEFYQVSTQENSRRGPFAASTQATAFLSAELTLPGARLPALKCRVKRGQ